MNAVGNFSNCYCHTVVTREEVHCYLEWSPPRTYLRISENIFDCYDCGSITDLQWVEEMLLNIIMHRIALCLAPHSHVVQNYLIQNVNRTKVDKPWP